MTRLLVWVAVAVCACAADITPLKEVRAGQRGIGRTVFSGRSVEEFQVEVLGVLENVGPRQSIILARLSGGPLASTGVMQGMSGSPVYIGGKLAGAVAYSFTFSKEPIAGIRPIEEMLALGATERPANRRAMLGDTNLIPAEPRREIAAAGFDSRLREISTPVWFAGFTPATVEFFAPQLRALGLEPRQGVSGGGRPAPGDSSKLEPGSMISVQLLTGDLSAGADGTVTHIDGRRVFAFGHRFLAAGDTDLPFARAEVITLLASVSTSFKIATAREWMGAITQDRSAAVSGELGRRAPMIPVSIEVNRQGPATRRSTYQMEMAHDRFLSPFLVQMAVFSSIDATERGVGQSSFGLRGQIQFDGAPPVRLDNIYAGDFSVTAQAALGVASPLAYAMQNAFSSLKVKSVSVAIDSFDEKKQLQIDQVWTSGPTARPGETVELNVLFAGEGGVETARKARYTIPVGAPAGPLYFTVADGMTTNYTEYRQLAFTPPRSASQLLSLLNGLRGNRSAWIRVWRADPGYQIQGEDLPAPPPSVSMVLARAQASLGSTPARNSKVAEIEMRIGDQAVTGSRTVQVDVKE